LSIGKLPKGSDADGSIIERKDVKNRHSDLMKRKI
jgi:hypothetical protein